MSAFFAINTGERSFMFTDGAGYTSDGVVRSFGTKVSVAATVPFAVTTLGNADLGERTRRFLVVQAEKFGVDEFVDTFLPMFLSGLQETYQQEPGNRHNNMMAAMSLWSPTRGVMHLGFQTVAEEDIVPFALRDLGRTAMRGPEFPFERMATVRAARQGEPQDDFIRDLGVTVMGFMREKADVTINMRGTGAQPHYYVGGHVDMTTIDESGARSERVHVWDDKIGQKIDPFGVAQTVVVPLFGNRHARRAAARG
ncbi:hypothetical protein [Rhizobium mesoamericanum]|uniref:hypothetical protein n=1 Tax=Rhizobium mesoamericanum TaxID=1079800 RepID=UPI0004196D57|nr:hypothetical protein [Rhizobium mesoamericanum]